MSDKMREEFEAWVRNRAIGTPAGFYPQLSHRCILDETRYAISWVDSAWEGWRASRSAVVIELPQIVGFEAAYDSLQDHELVPRMSDVEEADEIFGLVRSIEVREALDAAGVKCK